MVQPAKQFCDLAGDSWYPRVFCGVARGNLAFLGIGLLARDLADFGNLHTNQERPHTPFMPYAPQTEFRERAERVGFDEKTPVVVRFPGGVRCSAQLQIVSVTGGLLALQRPVQPGAIGKLMFLSGKGCIVGEAQMLTPVAWDRQPFKFTTLHDDDRYRLQTLIKRRVSLTRKHNELRRGDHTQVETVRPW
ncbi:MAG TPA: hypothetical protein VFA85_07070 [Terriglobales bacterium]|nr:hypothetical protein [Terriglobales bacterium]